jgi:nicotinic acid mononucleotide adenylyltransferase
MEVKKNDTNTVKSKPVKLKAKGRSLTGQPLDDIDLNPQLDTTDKQQVQEQSRGGVVLTFGRMNPPTVGHEKLVKKVVAVASQAKATPMVFLSHSQDKKKNPLEYEDKIRFAKAAFGNVVQSSPAKTLIDILKTLQQKFEELTLVVGSDRVSEFQTLLNKYNGKDFTFAKINVVSAGERDPDAEGVEGMSASKMRAAVQSGDEQKFISGLPQRLKSHGKDVFKMVSAGMQLHEELEAENLLSEVLSLDQRRKRALIMKRYSGKIERARELARKRMATTEKLKKRSFIQARDIVRRRVAGRRGAEYATLSPSEKIQIDTAVEKRKGAIKRIASRLMPQVKAAEYARLKSFTHGAQMQHLHSGPAVQHEQFNEAFEEFAKTIEIVTVDDILKEMTDLVLDKIITEKQIQALEKRAQRSGIQYDLLEQVYIRGLLDSMGDQNIAFNRVNAFCCGGKTAMNEDFDLYEQIEREDLNTVFEAGLWDNIHAKRKRIKAGSGERMRKPGSEGAPTKQNFRDASESIEEGYDVNSKHYKALTDLDLNTKNRDMTTQNDGYGPLNPGDTKGSKSFWEEKAKMWKTTTEAAMEARCGNCAAFNQAPAIMKKMAEGLGPAGEKIQDLANLGFCELFEFKCAGDRTCNKWLVNGPITEKSAGTEARKKIEKVDRKPPHTEHGKQAEIQTKIIDEEGNSQPNPRKRLQGTDSLVKAYKKDTPGEGLNESFNIAYGAGIGITLTAADMGIKAQGGFALHPSVIQQMEDEELEEAAKTADKAPVVIPAHNNASGKAVPAKTVMRRKSKTIVNSGDNPSDGQ